MKKTNTGLCEALTDSEQDALGTLVGPFNGFVESTITSQTRPPIHRSLGSGLLGMQHRGYRLKT